MKKLKHNSFEKYYLFDRFVNVGANIGYYCCHSAQLGISTVAFEPSPMNVSMLLKNLDLNGWGGLCTVFPIALTDKVGVEKLYGGGTGASLLLGWNNIPASFHTLVPASTLDKVICDYSGGLFLVDVEGAEYQMLQGAKKHLTRSSVWILEISISEHLPDGLKINPLLLKTFQLFWERGFRAFTFEIQSHEITQDVLENILFSGRDDIGLHNFIFIGPEAPEQIFDYLSIEKFRRAK